MSDKARMTDERLAIMRKYCRDMGFEGHTDTASWPQNTDQWLGEAVDALQAERAHVKRLEAVLEPFVRFADRLQRNKIPRNARITCTPHAFAEAGELSAGDCYAAREVLKP